MPSIPTAPSTGKGDHSGRGTGLGPVIDTPKLLPAEYPLQQRLAGVATLSTNLLPIVPASQAARRTVSLGESPLWPTAALIGAAALYADLPSRFIAGPSAGAFSIVRFVVPALTVIVLAVLLLSLPRTRLMTRLGWREHQMHVTRRWLSLTAIAIVSAANTASIILLVHLLVNGAQANASTLLRAAVHMWVVNVLLFALWYWQLDAGGPLSRPFCKPTDRDFLFPQQTEPTLLESGWRPMFLDYLYVSFTNATAFSPTDAMPLSRWAKMLMLVQSAISLTLAVMVVARAVNILR